MLDLFYEGGPLFMGLLTIILLLTVIAAVRTYSRYKQDKISPARARAEMSNVQSLGILAFVFGIFGQLLGLYDMFNAIQEIENVAPALLAGGLKVSVITTIYGCLILIIAIILRLALGQTIHQADE